MPAQQQLQAEIAALEHELRRVSDALERNRRPELERRARLLRDNIALCEHDLQQEKIKSGVRSSGG